MDVSVESMDTAENIDLKHSIDMLGTFNFFKGRAALWVPRCRRGASEYSRWFSQFATSEGTTRVLDIGTTEQLSFDDGAHRDSYNTIVFLLIQMKGDIVWHTGRVPARAREDRRRCSYGRICPCKFRNVTGRVLTFHCICNVKSSVAASMLRLSSWQP